MLGAWCNWYFEETSLLSPDAFCCLSGSDYRVDTRLRVDTEAGCVCTPSQTHGNNYSVWGIGSSVFVSLSLSDCLIAYPVLLKCSVTIKHLTLKPGRLLLSQLCFLCFVLLWSPLSSAVSKTKVDWLISCVFWFCGQAGFIAHISAPSYALFFCSTDETQ